MVSSASFGLGNHFFLPRDSPGAIQDQTEENRPTFGGEFTNHFNYGADNGIPSPNIEAMRTNAPETPTIIH
jgi:hypothetical protein